MGHHLAQIVKRVGKVGYDMVDGLVHAGMARDKIRKGGEIVEKHVVQTVNDLGIILSLQLVFIVKPCDHGQKIPRVCVPELDPSLVREGDVLKVIVNVCEPIVGVVGMNTAGGNEKNIPCLKADVIAVDLDSSRALRIAHHFPKSVEMQMVASDRRMNTTCKLYLGHKDIPFLFRIG